MDGVPGVVQGWGGVPGVGWDLGGYLGGLYRYPSQAIPGPIFHIFKAKRPTHGQMKAFLEVSMRFLRIDLRLTSDCPHIDLRYALR